MERAGACRLWACALLTLLLISGGLEARAEVVRNLDFQLGAGYRQDQFDWNIAGTPQGTSPNILSELEWKDLEIYQLRAKGKAVVGLDNFPYFDACVKGSLGYGWIVDGDNQDSDYLGDNRTFEFSRSNNETEDDDVFDAALAIGPRFGFREGMLIVTPLVGYSYHEQNLRITDGVQTVANQALADAVLGPGEVVLPPLGPFPGLNSTYEAEWYGPWLGVDLEIRPSGRLTLTGSVEYHWADYEAEADWNLRSDLAQPTSFKHSADGEGIVLTAAAAWSLGERWSVELSYDFADWETDPGRDQVFLADGTVGGTRLNEVNWESQAIMLGATYRFF
jgi:hypothetical protein